MSAAEIGNLRVRMGIDSAEFSNGVRAVQGSLASLSGSLRTFATGAAAITLFRSAVASLHDVADIGDVADAIGLSAEQLQVFQKMALASGTSTDVMARGLQSIAEQSTDASSKLSQLFAANGILTAGKEMNQIILEFMTLLQNAKTPAEQLAIATGVLGDKVGRQLVESLRSGASGWNEAFNSMVSDGWFLSNEQVKAAQEIETKYNQVIANLTSAWQGFVVTVAQSLAAVGNPDMGSAANKFRYNFGLGAAPGVASNSPSAAASGGKGDLPGNINPGKGYGLNKPTSNPFNGIKSPSPIVPVIPKNTVQDIYGAGEAIKALQTDMAEIVPQSNALADSFDGIAESITSGLTSSIQGLIAGTMSAKDAFSNMANSISQELASLAADLLKSGLFRILSMALAGPGGAGVSIGGSMFGGLFANGGTLGAGKWGIAGEAGPEIVHGPARITPMSGGGSTSVNWSPSIVINGNADQRQIGAVMAAEREKFKADLPKMIRDARKRGSI